jgi:CRISPR system Cascade subunit CasE
LYLSLLRLNPASAAVQRDLRDPVDLHRTIMRAFGDVLDPEVEARAYFGVLHRLEFDRSRGQILLYVQSATAPDWGQLDPGYLHPEDGLRVRPVGEVYAGLRAGRVLRFRLRANPTRKVDTKSGPDGERRNGRRVPLRGMDEQVGWLVRKASEAGFELLQATVAATGSGEYVRSHRTGRTFQGVLFEGKLVVRDVARFRSALAQGIGPAKAFGFGLLSVGPE